ncbi:MAG: dihydrolipoamide acetyltransferase family protein [Candidatus Competibacterales bacterium]
MSGVFRMPSLGADMDAGTLVEWMVKPGDTVSRGDIVAVVETQKGAIDIEIWEDGAIGELVVEVGTEVPVGTVLATLVVEGQTDGARAAVASEAEPALTETGPESKALAEVAIPPLRSPLAEGRRLQVSPRARRRAEALGVSLEAVTGTGAHGAITFDDVERAAAAGPAAAPPTATAPTPDPEAMRGAIAAAMSRANREIPHYYLGHTLDLEPALAWLEAGNRERSLRERILPIALLVRAVARGLREYPTLCGWFDHGRFRPSEHIDVGLAVVTRSGGLINPALPRADSGDLPSLWGRIRDLTERVRKGGLRASELSGGAITVSSLGDRGVDTVYGVVYPPQVAIVGFGTIAPRPWVLDGMVVARRTVEVTLAADHRVTDGHLGARFIRHVGKLLAEPEGL